MCCETCYSKNLAKVEEGERFIYTNAPSLSHLAIDVLQICAQAIFLITDGDKHAEVFHHPGPDFWFVA